MINLRKITIASCLFFGMYSINADTLYFTSTQSQPAWTGNDSFTISGSTQTKDPTIDDDVILDWSVNSSVSSNLFIRNAVVASCNSLTIQKDGKQRWLMVQIENDASLNIAKDFLLYNNWGNSYHRIESRYSKSSDLNVGGSLILNSSPLYIGGELDAGSNSNYSAMRKVTVGGDVKITSTTSTTSALYMNVGFYGDGASVDAAQVQIGGKVILTNSSAKNANWYLLNRGADTAGKVKTVMNTFIEVNGLEGNGGVLSASKNELGNQATLIFKNTTESTFTGTFNEGDMAKFNVLMRGEAKQILRGTNTFTGTLTVESGTLLINSAEDSIGAASISGGMLGAIGSESNVGNLKVGSLNVTGGSLYAYFDNAEASLISVMGDLTLSDKLNFTFDGDYLLNHDYRILDISNGADFTADDFSSNIADAIFEIRENSLYVTFTSVPEPAAMSVLLGVIAVAIAAYRRRK